MKKERRIRVIGKRREIDIGKMAIAVVQLADHLANPDHQTQPNMAAPKNQAAKPDPKKPEAI